MTCDHWDVWSPAMTTYAWYEPPEEFVCWGLFEAPTKRAALVAAVKSPDFKEWVAERRADGMPPFKGLQAKRPLCEHGNCWGCGECADCYHESTADAELAHPGGFP